MALRLVIIGQTMALRLVIIGQTKALTNVLPPGKNAIGTPLGTASLVSFAQLTIG
jgi:hypothetical protein